MLMPTSSEKGGCREGGAAESCLMDSAETKNVMFNCDLVPF